MTPYLYGHLVSSFRVYGEFDLPKGAFSDGFADLILAHLLHHIATSLCFTA